MADRRGVLFPLIILAFIFFNPAPNRQPAFQRVYIEDVIAEERRSLSAVQNSTFGDIENDKLLNVTGLELDRGYAWGSLAKVKARAQEHVDYVLGDWGKQALNGDIHDGSPTPLYRNATGIVHGKWLPSKLQESVSIPHLNLSKYTPEGPFGPLPPRPFMRNITGEGGDIRLRFHEKAILDSHMDGPLEINKMMVDITIQDAKLSHEWDMEAHGIYLPDLGQAILTTTSSKFAGIFMLPQFALSEHTFNASRAFLNTSLSRAIERQMDLGFQAPTNPWTSNTGNQDETPFTAPECDMIIYLQQLAPLGSVAYTSSALSFLERELRFPTGAFIPQEPDLRFSFLAFSPDCGFVLESQGPPEHIPQDGNHLVGSKIEVLHYEARHHLLLFGVALGAQLFLLMRQMREANTPSTRSRLSFYSVGMLAFGDAFTTLAFVILGVALGGLAVNLFATAFLAFVGGAFFGMRFLMDVWMAQAPERQVREREELERNRERRERLLAALQRIRAETAERRAALQNQAQTENAIEGETPANQPLLSEETPPASHEPTPTSLPLPVTAQRPTDTGATPVFMPSDQEGLEAVADEAFPTGDGAEPTGTTGFGALYTKFYLILLATLFLTLNAATWPFPVRRGFFALLSLAYLSFWTPQINRNVQRNSRRPLNREFVLGQSVLRLVPFAYFYAYSHNVLFAEPDYYTLALLTGWVWLQVLLLTSQDLLGPRWFVKESWVPEAYDYHPVLRADEEGASLPLGLSDAPTDAKDRRRSSVSSATSLHEKRAHAGSGTRVFDCAICMQTLEVAVVEADGSSGNAADGIAGGLLGRRTYMVTPCRHIFHSACLEGWMKYRLQCPNCRESLPGL